MPMPALTSQQSALLFVYTSVLIDQLGSALTMPVMPFYVTQLGGDATVVGLIFTAFSVGQVVSSAWMGIASDKFGRRPIILISLGGSSAGMLLSALAPSTNALLVARLLLGLFSGSYEVANAYIADVSAPSEVPKRMAILSAVAGLAYVVGPALGSALSIVAISFPFFAGATTSLAAAAVAYFKLPSVDELLECNTCRDAPSHAKRHAGLNTSGFMTHLRARRWLQLVRRKSMERKATNWHMVGAMCATRPPHHRPRLACMRRALP